MATLNISYKELSNAKDYASKASKTITEYAEQLEKRVSRKINEISGKQSIKTKNAIDLTNQKIRTLKDRATKLNTFSIDIDNFKQKVKDTDKKVAKSIKISSASFAKANDIKVSKVGMFFESLAVKSCNKTALGRWIKSVYNKGKELFETAKITIKHWYKTGGGEYVMDIALSVLAIGVAFLTIVTIGAPATLLAGFFAVMTVVSAGFTILNSLNNIVTSSRAIIKNNEDPAWARRYGKLDKVSDSLRKIGMNELATVFDITESVATVCAAVGGLRDSYNKFFKPRDIEDVKEIESIFMTFNNDKWSYSGKSVFNGLKSVVLDKDIRKVAGKSLINNLKFNFKKIDKLDEAKFFKWEIKFNTKFGKIAKNFTIATNKVDIVYKKIKDYKKFGDELFKVDKNNKITTEIKLTTLDTIKLVAPETNKIISNIDKIKKNIGEMFKDMNLVLAN